MHSKVSDGLDDKLECLELQKPLDYYHWESHLDRTIPDGCSAYLPTSWLANELGLVRKSGSYLEYEADVLINARGQDDEKGVYCDKDLLDQYLLNNGLSCVWLFFSERASYPVDEKRGAPYRLIEGYAFLDAAGRLRAESWFEDLGKKKALSISA